MAPRDFAWLSIVLLVWGCSSTGVVSDAEIQAEHHMAIADTLERASALDKAAEEYRVVAERFPTTRVYLRAVRKAGLLLGDPDNPAANDSASVYWLNKYRTLTPSAEEKQLIDLYVRMMKRANLLRDSLGRQAAVIDSLAGVSRKQLNEASSRARRIQDLETELQQVSTELRKLKEIDVRISKGREKKP